MNLIFASQDESIGDTTERASELDDVILGGVVRHIPEVKNPGRLVWIRVVESGALGRGAGVASTAMAAVAG